MSTGPESSSDGEKRFRAKVEDIARRAARWCVYRLLAVYYRFLYGSRRPGSRTLGRLVDWLESQERLYEAPLRRETWDRDFSEGVLLREPSLADFSSYTGLDLSETAVRRARRDYGDRASFVVADADVFVPSGSFDAIVFNEVQYCLSRPMAVLREYRGLLRPGGVLVTSSFRGSPRAMGILRRARESFVLRAESVTTSSSGASWSCSVFGSE